MWPTPLHLPDTPWKIYSNGHLLSSNNSFCNTTKPPIYVATTLPTSLVGSTYISHFFFVLQSGSAKERVSTSIKECSINTTAKFSSCNLSNILSLLQNFSWCLTCFSTPLSETTTPKTSLSIPPLQPLLESS